MSETVTFKSKVNGDSLELEKSEVEDVIRVNQACSDLILISGVKVRVEGGYSDICKKLDMDVTPEGIEDIGEDDVMRNDKKLKIFFN